MLDSYWFSLVYLHMTKGEKMKKSQIINYLKLITDELTDAHHLTDTDGTVDANHSVNTAQELVDELMDNINGKFDHETLMGPDGLPLNYPFGNN